MSSPSPSSFLPRIESVFYAVFDEFHGPKLVCQVPEALIAVPVDGVDTADSPVAARQPVQRSSATLFSFDDISKYVIPHSQLCGRLVTCSTDRHRIIGFPVELRGHYSRNYFRYNLCFVFDRAADLSCYQPIVRKVSRVLSSCEKESRFLSSTTSSAPIHAILEQLYEDLNSYSESSILIDPFNSIELKIFPFYPNPPNVNDWAVPLALINITKRMEDNWDLSMVKVCKFIDGTNHVSRIAHLADCDIVVTRRAISHLLFYQVIMTIDIFQYSNMYTLRKTIQWLADEAHVREECGPYVTTPGNPIPPWPKLLHLYSRLKQGKTVLEWMEAHNVHQLGIDIRRFTSFGVIKGFLRRVHRWPVLLPPDPSKPQPQPQPQPIDPTLIPTFRKRGDSLSGIPHHFPAYGPSPPLDTPQPIRPFRNHSPSAPDTASSLPVPNILHPRDLSSSTTKPLPSTKYRTRRASAAEKVLEQLRSRDLLKSGAYPTTTTTAPTSAAAIAMAMASANGPGAVPTPSPRTSWIHYQQKDDSHTATTEPGGPATVFHNPRSQSRRQSLIAPTGPPPSPVLPKSALPGPTRPRPTWSPSAPNIAGGGGLAGGGGGGGGVGGVGGAGQVYPPELLGLLDGEHHTDELAVRFEAGWPILETWLVAAGGGQGDGDFGRVCIIYR